MKVYQALAAAFAGEGVTAVFGIMGDGNMYWMSTVEKDYPAMRIYEARHEGAGLAMADGWARVTGEPSVCAVTSGPGLAQLSTSLLVASRARTPVVVFAGDTPEASLNHSQRLNQARFAEANEAGFVRLSGSDGAHDAVRRAFNQARLESRPVILSCPMDVQQLEYDGPEEYEPSKSIMPPAPPLPPDRTALAAAAEIVASSKRPVIIAGRGALAADAGAAILRLGERIGALIATTLLAKTYLAGADFHSGIAGLFAPKSTTELYAEADCVIGVGAGLNTYTLESGYLFPDARFVHIDHAAQVVMGTGRMADCYVRGDARLTVEALEALLAEQSFASNGYRTPPTREKLRAEIDPQPYDIPPGTLDPRVVAAAIDEALPGEIGAVMGVGHYFSFPAMHMTRARSPWLTALQMGSIGQALGTAIGASIATRRPIVLVEGDASILMHIQELDTIRRYKVPVLMAVMNDEALGAEYQKLRAHDLDPEPAYIATPDLSAVARGMGLLGRQVTKLDDLKASLAAFVAKPEPTLLDVRITRNVISVPYRRLHFGQSA